MNTITTKANPVIKTPRIGDLYLDSNEELYILARVDLNVYSAISLKDGEPWTSDPRPTVQEAIYGLIFCKRNAKITIE